MRPLLMSSMNEPLLWIVMFRYYTMAKQCATTGPWLMRTSLMRFLLPSGNVSQRVWHHQPFFLYVPRKIQFLLLGAEHAFASFQHEPKVIITFSNANVDTAIRFFWTKVSIYARIRCISFLHNYVCQEVDRRATVTVT